MQRAADAGALEAIVAAMTAHPQVEAVQEKSCWALINVCAGEDAAGLARRQRAAMAVPPLPAVQLGFHKCGVLLQGLVKLLLLWSPPVSLHRHTSDA